jgi:hypothetical protein
VTSVGIYQSTYWHFGRKAATIMPPDTPSVLPLKSASVMVVSIVTGSLLLSPLKVNVDNALLSEDVRDVEHRSE